MTQTIKQILEATIIRNNEMIETNQSLILTKVNNLCKSSEVKKLLKDTNFKLEDNSQNRKRGILFDIKFTSTDETYPLYFNISQSYSYDYSTKETLYAPFKVSQLSGKYSFDNIVDFIYTDKQTDFERLTKYYEVYDKYQIISISPNIKELLDVLNEFVEISNQLKIENSSLQNELNRLDMIEVENLIKDLLYDGGELEYGIEQRVNGELVEDEFGKSERIYQLENIRHYTSMDWKDKYGSKYWDVFNKIIVGDKLKSKQSWEVELYFATESDIDNFKYIGTAIITKKTLSELIERIFNSNQKIQQRTNDAVQIYNEKTTVEEV